MDMYYDSQNVQMHTWKYYIKKSNEILENVGYLPYIK